MVTHRGHLVKTLLTALVVGTVLVAINQGDILLLGQTTTATYVKIALTYVVPFCVSNFGILVATRRETAGK